MSTIGRQFKKKEDYKKRNTEYFKQFVGGFSSWGNLISVLNRNRNEYEGSVLLMGLFMTASRSSELSMLTKRMVDTTTYPDQIMIKEQPVLKQKDKVYLVDEKGKPLWKDGEKEYTFESKAGYRTYLFPKREPLAPWFLQVVKACKDDEPLFPYDRKSIYYHLSRLDGEPIPEGESHHWSRYKGPIWGHRLRSERVCQLIKEYDYTQQKCKTFIGWKTGSMVDVYASMYPKDLIVNKEVEYK